MSIVDSELRWSSKLDVQMRTIDYLLFCYHRIGTLLRIGQIQRIRRILRVFVVFCCLCCVLLSLLCICICCYPCFLCDGNICTTLIGMRLCCGNSSNTLQRYWMNAVYDGSLSVVVIFFMRSVIPFGDVDASFPSRERT